jgi:DNA-binding NarL/FixJ family response regulator
MINIAILDDHKLMAKSLSKLIDDSNIAKVTQVFQNINSCRSGLKKPLPDILLLDIGLPDGNGVDFCAELKKKFPKLKIIMLTTYREFNVAMRALQSGAFGYVLKNSEPEEIMAAIETVNAGEKFLCEEIDILLSEKANEEVVWFSPREKEILQYIADGFSTKQIADKLSRTDETVRSFRRILLIKFEAGNTAQMIKKACDQNLVR